MNEWCWTVNDALSNGVADVARNGRMRQCATSADPRRNDTLHPAYDHDWVARAYAAVGLASHLTWLGPTRRITRMRRLFNSERFTAQVDRAARELACLPHVRKLVDRGVISGRVEWPLANLWPAASVEDQQSANRRPSALCDVPIAAGTFRWLSCEPLIEHTTVERWLGAGMVQWLVVGGESGQTHGARPVRRMDPSWARSLLDQGKAAGIAVFTKQTGSVTARQLGLTDPKSEDPAEWPRMWHWPRSYPPLVMT